MKRNLPGQANEKTEKSTSAEAHSQSEKPVFNASRLKSSFPRTAEEIRRAFTEGRFAEMTPRQAGEDSDR